jgi:hypothetical protein
MAENMQRYIFHATAVAAHSQFTKGEQNFGHEYSLAFHGDGPHEQQCQLGGLKHPKVSFSGSFVSISCKESGGVYTTIVKSGLTGFSARGIVTADKIEAGIMTVYRRDWYGNPKFPKRARVLPLTPVFGNLKVCGIPFGPRLKLPAPFLYSDTQRDDYFRGNGDEIDPQGISRKFGPAEGSERGEIRVSPDGRRIKIPKFGIVEFADWTWQRPEIHLHANTSQWVQMIRIRLANPGPTGGGGGGGNGSPYP